MDTMPVSRAVAFHKARRRKHLARSIFWRLIGDISFTVIVFLALLWLDWVRV